MRTRLASLITIMCLAPQAAWAIDAQKISDIAFDCIVLRPLGGATTLVGGALFGPAVVFGGASGRAGMEEAYDIFLAGPWETTVERPLGEF